MVKDKGEFKLADVTEKVRIEVETRSSSGPSWIEFLQQSSLGLYTRGDLVVILLA